MGSPPGPVLADIFMGYIESKVHTALENVTIYRRYVDNSFIRVDYKSLQALIHAIIIIRLI